MCKFGTIFFPVCHASCRQGILWPCCVYLQFDVCKMQWQYMVNGTGWIVYFTLTLVLITVFYFVIIMLNIQVTAPPSTWFVFICQTYHFIERLYVDLDMNVVIASQIYKGSSENCWDFLSIVSVYYVVFGTWTFSTPSSHLSMSVAGYLTCKLYF